MLINDKEDKLDGFKGLAKRNPFLGFVSILALLSLAVVPPLVGFFGKYLVFASAITDFPVLVVIAIINSDIGIYYYLKTIMTIVSKEDVSTEKVEVSSIQYLVLVICTIGLLVGGMLISHI